MATTQRIIKTTFKLRRGLKATWERDNPTLAYGEPGYEKDTNRLKIGDGEKAWNDLPYLDTSISLEEYDEQIKAYIDGKIPAENILAQLTDLGSIVQETEDNTIAWGLKNYIDSQDLAVYNAIGSIEEENIENLFTP